MAADKILLSICIPTYNRAPILRDTLMRITSDPAFDSEVEIIVSDNNSTDNTKEIVVEFMTKYSNVYYYRNSENVGDKNFSIVLGDGKGEYLKLMNDYLSFREGMLADMKETIRENLETRPALFFIPKLKKRNKKKKMLNCESLNDFVNTVSCYVTRISSFGCWREDFENMENKNRYLSTCIQQMDWAYRIVLKRKGAIIWTQRYFRKSDFTLGIRGGYNFLGVHIDNYYKLMQDYISSGHLSPEMYDIDRRYTLWHFHNKLKNLFLFRIKKYNFSTKQSFSILYRYYKKYPLLYLYIFTFAVLCIPFLLFNSMKNILIIKIT